MKNILLTWFRYWLYAMAFMCGILLILSSCGQRAWQKRGTNKGWITEKSAVDTIFIPADSILIDSTAESFIVILDTLLQDTCINKANRAKIKRILKTDFIPAAQRVYRDTAVLGKDGNIYNIKFTPAGIEITAAYTKQNIEAISDPWWSDWYYWVIIVLLVLLILIRKKS